MALTAAARLSCVALDFRTGGVGRVPKPLEKMSAIHVLLMVGLDCCSRVVDTCSIACIRERATCAADADTPKKEKYGTTWPLLRWAC